MTTRDHIHCTEPPEGDDDMRSDEDDGECYRCAGEGCVACDARKLPPEDIAAAGGATSVPASWAAERAEAHEWTWKAATAGSACPGCSALLENDYSWMGRLLCPGCGLSSPKPPIKGFADGVSGVVNTPPTIQDFPAFGDAVSRAMPYVVGGGVNYLCVACRDTGIAGKNICVSCPRCDSDSCLTPDEQRTPIRQQFGLHLCNPHTGARWCNVACLRASGLDDCMTDSTKTQLLAAVFGEFIPRMRQRCPHSITGSHQVFHERTLPLLEELTQYAQAALAGLRPEEGSS